MKRFIAVGYCCAFWSIKDAASFFVGRAVVARVPSTNSLFLANLHFSSNNVDNIRHDARMTRRPHDCYSRRTQRERRDSTTTLIEAAETSKEWLGRFTSAVVVVSVLVGASVLAPLDAVANAKAAVKKEPVVQALVQLPDEQADWTKLLADAAQAPGANMVVMASQEGSGKPALGATVAMDKLTFPVMVQLFPTNVVGGAIWPGDFQEQGEYAVEVAVCGGTEARGVLCKSPPLAGTGESIFVTQLEDVPEVAESGGMRVPATVVLTPPP